MKLYMHPVSTASRPVRLFIAEKKLPVEEQLVDLMKGEHHQEPYCSINPNRLVPTLVDGDLCLTESATILKYLAAKFEQPEYPTELKARAKVDEVIDWFNTQLYREFGYHLTYPQIFPNHKRPSDEVQQATIAWGKDKAVGWFKILDEHFIGGNPYVAGKQITVADYFGACLVTLGEVIRCDYSAYPNISRWIGTMKKLGSWNKVNEALHGFTGMVKDQPFEAMPMIKGLHHNAYRCRDSEETRKFYEDFLGLPLVNAFEITETKSGRKTSVLHSFYAMDDGSCLAFFEAPDMPFEFKAQHDFDLHIAVEVPRDVLEPMLEKGKRAGIETRGISDHVFIDSIYFRDPNGYVIELTAKRANHDQAMTDKGTAKAELERWQKTKPAAG